MARSTGNRAPIGTLLLAALIFAGFVLGPEEGAMEAERAREEAQAFYHQHPGVTLTSRDRALLGTQYVDHVGLTRGVASEEPRLPARRARIQRQFDGLADTAARARRAADPAWRFGVDTGDPVSSKFFAYGFFHEEVIAFAISLLLLLIVGVGIEGAWGSVVFLLLCGAGLFVPALVHAALAPGDGVPLSGASGLLAALLVVYGLRGSGGRFLLPGWALLPAWLFAEYVIVRGMWFDQAEGLPLYAHGAGLALGGLAVAAVALFGVERRLAERANPGAAASDPALALATRALAEGQSEAAWSALANGWAANPGDDELAVAWWKLACDQARAPEAVEAILPRVRQELRAGDVDTALGYWFDIVQYAPEAEVEGRLTIRLAEALIDRGERAGAREALRRTLADPAGVPTALAQRVARCARELDPEIAAAAARIALKDDELDPASREFLQALVGAAGDVPSVADRPLEGDEDEPAEPVLELGAPRAHAGTASPGAPDAEADRIESSGAVAEQEEAAPEPGGQEPGQETVSELGLAEGEELTDPQAAQDGPGGAGVFDLSALDRAAISIAGPEDATEAADPEEAEAGDAGAPLAPELAEEATPLAEDDVEEGLLLEGAELEEADDPADIAAGYAPIDAADDDTVVEATDELLIEDPLEVPEIRRVARVLEGFPVAIGDEAIEVEIEGRGRGRIPYARVEAVAVAAVSGLSTRPVLVIDLVLNWNADPGEALKLIRIRGNGFDPLSLSPGAPSPLQALKDMISTIARASGARCVPDPAAVGGNPYRRFDDLAGYEREVLGVGD